MNLGSEDYKRPVRTADLKFGLSQLEPTRIFPDSPGSTQSKVVHTLISSPVPLSQTDLCEKAGVSEASFAGWGESTLLTAEATYSNGTTLTVTDRATLSSNESSVATVEADGTVTAEGPGRTDLHAELGGRNNTIAVSVSNPPRNSDSSSSSRDVSDEDEVDVEMSDDGSVSVRATASADEPTSIDLGGSVSDAESGTSYSRVELTFGEGTEVTFEARPTSREELPEGTSSLGDNGVDSTDENGADRAISYVEFTASSDGVDASDRVSSATIGFDVSTERLAERGVAAEDIALHRYDDEASEWTELDTEIVSKGDQTVSYESTTPGFSVFAVGERAASEMSESTNPTESIDESTERSETDDETPGFGLLVGFVSLLTLSVLVGRSQRSD